MTILSAFKDIFNSIMPGCTESELRRFFSVLPEIPIVSYNVCVEPSLECRAHSQCNTIASAELFMSDAHNSEYRLQLISLDY